ncbi:MAG: ABC transporter ATP-binding protein [Gemmatimonadaceae bacterium]|nr:ABC transporter ATP-binding protein [Gemmatimonadaceae bacterium]
MSTYTSRSQRIIVVLQVFAMLWLPSIQIVLRHTAGVLLQDNAVKHDPLSLRESFRLARRVFLLMRPFWSWMLRNTGVTVVIGLVGTATPLLSKLLFDEAYPSRDVPFALLLVTSIFVITLTTAILTAGSSYLTQTYSGRLTVSADLMFFNHIQHLPMAFFEHRPSGEIMSRFGDLRSSLSTVSGVIQTILVSGIHLAIVPLVMLYLNWQLTLLSVIVLPITVFVSVYSSKMAQKHIKRNAEARADLSAYQFEILSQMRGLKPLALEYQATSHVMNRLDGIFDTQMRAARVQISAGFLNASVQALGALVFGFYSWRMVLGGELSVGSFIAFSAYVSFPQEQTV